MAIFERRSNLPIPVTITYPSSSVTDALTSNPTLENSINLIANAISDLPLNLYWRNNDGTKDVAYSNTLFDLLKHSPAEGWTPKTFLFRIVYDLLRHGNAFIRPFKNKDGEYVALIPLMAKYMRVVVKNGQKKYFYQNQEVYFPLVHIPGLNFDGVQGYSPIIHSLKYLSTSEKINTYVENTFQNSVTTTMVLQKKQGKYTKEEAQAIIDLVKKQASSTSRGAPVLLPPDWEYVKDSIRNDNDILQLIQNREYQDKLIAQIFNVPLHLLGLQESKYNNIEIQQTNFLQYTLLPWMKIIEQGLNITLLDAFQRIRFYFEFNTNEVLRIDFGTRMEGYVKQIMNGMLSVNEINKMENRAPIGPEGDVRFVQANLMPLTMENINAYMASSKQKMQEAPGQGSDKL